MRSPLFPAANLPLYDSFVHYLIGYLTTLSMSGPSGVDGRMINERGAVGGTKIGNETERCNGL